jgi:hypothetical protein
VPLQGTTPGPWPLAPGPWPLTRTLGVWMCLQRSAQQEHSRHVGAQLAHAHETNARLEAERLELVDAVSRQEGYWRRRAVRSHEAAAGEDVTEWSQLMRVLDRLGMQVPPLQPVQPWSATSALTHERASCSSPTAMRDDADIIRTDDRERGARLDDVDDRTSGAVAVGDVG